MELMISYARRRNDKFVYELAERLHNTPGFSVWIDRNQIVGSSAWWTEICKAVEDANCMMVILTPRYLESIYCMAELHYALALNKAIYPLMLETLEKFPREISDRQIDDIRELSLNDVVTKCFPGFMSIQQETFSGRYQLPDPPPERPDVPKAPPPPTRSAPDLFDAAMDAADQGNIDEAKGLLKELQRLHPDDPHSEDAAEMLEEIALEEDRATDYKRLADRLQKAKSDLAKRGAKRMRNRFIEKYGIDYDPLSILTAQAEAEPPPVVEVTTPPEVESPPSKIEVTPPPQSTAPRIEDILPQPFAWIEIPGGRGTLKTSSKSVTLEIPTESYWMAKYPVTNGQFRKFVEAGGYREERWWTKQGWELRQSESWTEPSYWNNGEYNGVEQPVVGVSWYEAVAFCSWLNSLRAVHEPPLQDMQVMLPTEAQWQYAAQGDDGREYPWGNGFDQSRCNTKESGIGKTTPVTRYEGKGDSFFGVVDMAGNVWEWCLTDYDQHTNDVNSDANRRVLRGGSWLYFRYNARAAYRSLSLPNNRNLDFGFRLVRAPSLKH